MRLAGIALCCALGGCSSPPQKITLRIELPEELGSRAKDLQVLPAIAEVRREVGSGVVAVELKAHAGYVDLALPGACPERIQLASLAAGKPHEIVLQPLHDTGPAERVVGLGKAFSIQAKPNCAAASPLRTSFRVTGGAPLEGARFDPASRQFSAATRPVPPNTSTEHGILPVSARAQQALRSEVTFQVELAGGKRIERVLGISAVARASGLSDVALSHPILLGGAGWQLLEKPPGSQAKLRAVGNLFELLPDESGRYRVRDAAGRTISVSSGRYDQMPLDCGRSGCHSAIAKSAQASPMTQALASDLGGCHSLTNPACASACHATGEPGTQDGGFVHVASELGLPALPPDYDDLPRALRRLGGVGCMACHGPAKIPEPSQRFALMRNDVCAVCHDSPPRYGHVQALQASRMGHADSSPEARREPACARCHTAWGAVGRPAPPDEDETFGLTCATCHDVHPHGQASQPQAATEPGEQPTHGGLLRQFPLPETLPNPPASLQGISRVCISCHAPSSNTRRPEASAAAIVAGQGGLEPTTGAPLEVPAPHATTARGCMSCHDSGPEQLVLGKSHAFRATDEACARCHTPKPRDASIAERARALLARLDPEHAAGDLGKPWHARYQAALHPLAQTRALRNVLLVLEDPAADVHHPAYARALLDSAEHLAPGANR